MADVLPHDASFLGHFDAARPTVIAMHGWNGKTDGGSVIVTSELIVQKLENSEVSKK